MVSAAQSAASGFNSLANTLTSTRQTAENSIGSEVDAANAALAAIGSVSKQIVQLQAQGQSTASLADQRDAAMTTLSNLMNVKYTETSNGNMLVSTPNGIILPTDPSKGTLSTTTQNLSATESYPSTIPGIMINGVDVTSSITGGTMGANIKLRDTDIPTAQAELDSLSSTVAQRFSAQGLDLFADVNGAVVGTSTTQAAPNGIVGYAASMQVNPSVLSNPSLVSSGTGTPSVGGTYSVGNIVTYAFGQNASSSATQPTGPERRARSVRHAVLLLFRAAARCSTWPPRCRVRGGRAPATPRPNRRTARRPRPRSAPRSATSPASPSIPRCRRWWRSRTATAPTRR